MMVMLKWLFVVCCAFASTSNYVSSFFRTSERQIESKSQCLELRRALLDVSDFQAKDFDLAKYKNFDGVAKQWTFFELLNRHYVPDQALDKNAFLRDHKSRVAMRAIQSQIKKLGDCQSYAD